MGVENRPMATLLDPDSTMDTIAPLIELFCPAFSKPTYANFRFLILAWLKCGQAKISQLLRAADQMAELYPKHGDDPKHFSAFYRFFAQAKWSLDELGYLLARAIESRLGKTVVVLVDDTVFRRTGPRILGAGIHFDPLTSTYSGKQGKQSRFCFGLRFVTVAIWIPVGFMRSGGIAVPILFRLYRSLKSCSPSEHTKFTVLAAQMLRIVEGWWPERKLLVIGDRDYCCKTVFEHISLDTEMAGRLPMNAALYDPNFEQTPGLGRKRTWGPKLLSPKQLLDDDSHPFEVVRVYIYGRQLTLQVKTMQAQWKSAGAKRTLTVVITRDPTGRFDDACYFRSRADCSPNEVLISISLRWTLESCYRDVKQHLRLEEVQNGFARGSQRADTTKPGPQPELQRNPLASRRTIPIGMLAYSVVVLWYLNHGKPLLDIKLARILAPWYAHKHTISFGDMLQAFRRQMELEAFWQTRPEAGFTENKLDNLTLHPPPGPYGARSAPGDDRTPPHMRRQLDELKRI